MAKNDNLGPIVIGILIFVFIILPMFNKKDKFSNVKDESEENKLVKIDERKCSMDCCKFTQWPVPHMQNKENDNIGTNMSCNLGSTSGCVCMTNNDFDYLSNRGNNARS